MRPLDSLKTVDHVVTRGSRDGADTTSVVLTQTYPVGIGDLWDACTSAARINRWLMPVSGDLRLGGRYQLEGNAGGVVQDCEPTSRLAITWEYAGDVSWVVATFTGDEASSTLRVEHTAVVDQERWDQFGPGAVGIGWDMMFLGLAMHIESAADRDSFDSAGWPTTAEGKAFMTTSGEAWRAAEIASGADEEAATAAARRCIAAYTGG